ncbi:hypothetical protein B0H14DRAFT_2588870 [Mycena olivaceomarginata]|nr:hypothetical protein B0H14DRAFT_2588870 [Mycena olivaceomarginata]
MGIQERQRRIQEGPNSSAGHIVLCFRSEALAVGTIPQRPRVRVLRIALFSLGIVFCSALVCPRRSTKAEKLDAFGSRHTLVKQESSAGLLDECCLRVANPTVGVDRERRREFVIFNIFLRHLHKVLSYRSSDNVFEGGQADNLSPETEFLRVGKWGAELESRHLHCRRQVAVTTSHLSTASPPNSRKISRISRVTEASRELAKEVTKSPKKPRKMRFFPPSTSVFDLPWRTHDRGQEQLETSSHMTATLDSKLAPPVGFKLLDSFLFILTTSVLVLCSQFILTPHAVIFVFTCAFSPTSHSITSSPSPSTLIARTIGTRIVFIYEGENYKYWNPPGYNKTFIFVIHMHLFE